MAERQVGRGTLRSAISNTRRLHDPVGGTRIVSRLSRSGTFYVPPHSDTERIPWTHLGRGGRKIRDRLEMDRCSDIPAATSISPILKSNGLMEEKPEGENHRIVRFERDRPNQLCQIDFEGYFGQSEGGRCHPLTALDGHRRFSEKKW